MVPRKERFLMERVNSEENRILTLSTHVMRSVAEQHGGTILREMTTDKVAIIVPKEQREICLEEIGQRLAIIRDYMHASLLALRDGKVIVWSCNN
jgi:hypothetical protein